MKIAVQTEDFDVQAEVAALHGSPKVGAVVMFLGTVRDLNEGDEVASMTLEHYPGMTEKALTAIVKEAEKRWDIMDATVIHRVGELFATDQIVFVGVSGAHRGEAFKARSGRRKRWARAPAGYRPKRPTKPQNPSGANKLKIREKRTSVSADSSE